jgi:hypothetical protein
MLSLSREQDTHSLNNQQHHHQHTKHSVAPFSNTPHSKAKTNWGKVDKSALAKLINNGDINKLSTANMGTIRTEFFPHGKLQIFCCNLCNFAAAWDVKTKYQGARQNDDTNGKHCIFILSSEYHSSSSCQHSSEVQSNDVYGASNIILPCPGS